MAAITNPTNLTPPRVALIDARSGAISREWYRFFLSLLTATQTTQTDVATGPDATALLASYDAMINSLAQAGAVAPDVSSSVADADAKIDALAMAVGSMTAAVTDSDTAALQTQLQALAQDPAPVTDVASIEAQLQALAQDPAPVTDLASIEAQLQALALTPPAKQFLTPRYGSFFDTTDQVAGGANTAYAMTFNNTDLSQGVYIGSPTSRVYVDRPNIYNIQFSAQFINTSGGAHDAWIWLAKNGTAVPSTATAIRVEGNNTQDVAAWNFLLQLNAGDYFELMWEVSDVSLSLQHDAASAVHPAIPSIILTVTDNVSSLEV